MSIKFITYEDSLYHSIYNINGNPNLPGEQAVPKDEDFPALCTLRLQKLTTNENNQSAPSTVQSYASVVRNGLFKPMKLSLMRNLPLEIREKIWEEIIRGTEYSIPGRNGYPTRHLRHFVHPVEIRRYHDGLTQRPPFLPRWCLCLRSKQVFDETIPVFIRNTVFMITSFQANRFFRDFLDTIAKGFHHVRHLRFNSFDYFPEDVEINSDFKLAADCPGLTTISLSMHCNNLSGWVLLAGDDNFEDGLTRCPRSVRELVERYKFTQLLECKSLQKIIWHYKGYYYEAADEALRDLGAWMEAEFAKQQKRVESEYI